MHLHHIRWSVQLGQAMFAVLLPAVVGCQSPQKRVPADEKTGSMFQSIAVKGIATSIAKYPVSGTVRATQQGVTLIGSLIGPGMRRHDSFKEPPPAAGTSPPMDQVAFDALLDRKLGPRRAAGTVRLLIDGKEFFPRLSEAIRQTPSAVDVQFYIFDRDEVAVKTADEFKAAAQRVPVRILVDDLGTLQAGNKPPETPPPSSFRPPADIMTYLKEGSPQVQVRKIPNVFLTSSHTKIILLGPSLAYIGGMNIGREYRSELHDLMGEVQGPVVGLLQQEFERGWRRGHPLGDWSRLWPRQRRAQTPPATPSAAEGGQIRVLRTNPFDYEIQTALHLAIDNAQSRIWMQNPYFSDDAIVRKLLRARHRGVDVRVILPEDAKTKTMNENNRSTAANMIKHGIRVYQYPGETHIKAGLFDNWGLIGSANFDRLSLRLNDEVNIAYSYPSAIREMEHRLFRRDFGVSRELRHPPSEDGSTGLFEFVADAL